MLLLLHENLIFKMLLNLFSGGFELDRKDGLQFHLKPWRKLAESRWNVLNQAETI
jgi:hypothetical protein